MKRKRPKLPNISDEMKAWSAALASEVADWPQVTTRPFLGLNALYRGERIFAALPRTRAMGTPNSIAFKLESPTARVRARLEQDARVDSTQMQSARWFTFEIAADADLRNALEWLGRAYQVAGKKNER